MRLISFFAAGASRVGMVTDNAITDLTARHGVQSMLQALSQNASLRRGTAVKADYYIDDVECEPVVRTPSRIFCVGLNYRAHLAETGHEAPNHPLIFTRWASSQVGHNQAIVRPRESERLDFEGELAVVIGADCRRVPRHEASRIIAGYSPYNDGSIRDWQRHSSQYIAGKNFPNTGGFGPCLVTPDEVDDIGSSQLVTRLNGQEMQRATIDDLVFDIPTIIEYCSSFTPLSIGDVIITGTAGGVGAARNPPVWMKPGDVVEVEISGVGLLRNPIIDEAEDDHVQGS